MSTASNVTIIPAKAQTEINRDKYHQLRVAAYCRVSTEQEEQQNSYQVQIAYYTDLINRKKEWTLAGIFADEGISGTQTKKRTEFNRMIRMCRNKKIDLVITKSISRFARNTVDCLEYVRQLKDLGIGVVFEKENINTMCHRIYFCSKCIWISLGCRTDFLLYRTWSGRYIHGIFVRKYFQYASSLCRYGSGRS